MVGAGVTEVAAVTASAAEVLAVMALADPPELLAATALVRDSGTRADFRVEGFWVRTITVARIAAVLAGGVMALAALMGTFSISASTGLVIPITPTTTPTRSITRIGTITAT